MPYPLLVLIFGLLTTSVSTAFANCIGVITAGGGQAFWQEVEQGALQAGKELGIRVFVRGPIDEVDVNAQNNLIQWVENSECIGLVLAPNHPSHKEAVTHLKEIGIPTVFIDRDIGGDRVSVIKTNNENAGRLAGEMMANALGGTGRIAVLRMDPAVQTTTQRENTFIEAAEQIGLEVVVEGYIGTRVGTAREKAFNLLEEQGPVDGLFTPNEVTTLAAQAALHSLPADERPIHIGFDANPVLLNAIRAKRLYGLIVQNPEQMGYQGVHQVYKAIQGGHVEPDYDVPVSFMGLEQAQQL